MLPIIRAAAPDHALAALEEAAHALRDRAEKLRPIGDNCAATADGLVALALSFDDLAEQVIVQQAALDVDLTEEEG